MDPSDLARVPPPFPLDRPFPFFPTTPPRILDHASLQPAPPPFPFPPCSCCVHNRHAPVPPGHPLAGYPYGGFPPPPLLFPPAPAWDHGALGAPGAVVGFKGGGGSSDMSRADPAGELYVDGEEEPAEQAEEEDEEDEEVVFVLSDEWAEFFAKSEARRREEKQKQRQQQKGK